MPPYVPWLLLPQILAPDAELILVADLEAALQEHLVEWERGQRIDGEHGGGSRAAPPDDEGTRHAAACAQGARLPCFL